MLLSPALWAVVNNAGIATFTEIEWCSVDQFQRILDVNVLGVVRVTKAFLPLLRYSHGRVVNVASLAGKHAVFGSTQCPCTLLAFGAKLVLFLPSLLTLG